LFANLETASHSVFETVRIYHERPFRLMEHIGRLFDSARTAGVKPKWTESQVRTQTLKRISKIRPRPSIVRLVLGQSGLEIQACPPRSVPAQLYSKGTALMTSVTRRTYPNSVSPQAKTHDYLNGVLARCDRLDQSVFDVLMLTSEGYVAEATTSNIFIVKKGSLLTPPAFVGILDGVTRRFVMELASQASVSCREEVLLRHDLYNADECFLTNTSMEIMPVVKIDGREIGTARPGLVTRRLHDMFRGIVRQSW
jgi:branched-chain amino acid aminotransferase